jgi:hypothetical protein
MDATTTATSGNLKVVGYDAFTPLFNFLFGTNGLVGGASVHGWLGFFGTLWDVFVVLSYILSAVFLVLYIYASIEKARLEEEEAEHIKHGEDAYAAKMSGGSKVSDRFAELKTHLESENPNDWKLAIIEADIILEKALKDKGYAGPTIGDMLKSVAPSSMQSLQDAWDAHLVRNKIAHSGEDFVLTHKIARETIVQYDRVFAELGVGKEGDTSHH